MEMSFVGENATVKASCEVPAEKFFAIPSSNERRVSSSSWSIARRRRLKEEGARVPRNLSLGTEFNVDQEMIC